MCLVDKVKNTESSAGSRVRKKIPFHDPMAAIDPRSNLRGTLVSSASRVDCFFVGALILFARFRRRVDAELDEEGIVEKTICCLNAKAQIDMNIELILPLDNK
jgi:hypothetical protein